MLDKFLIFFVFILGYATLPLKLLEKVVLVSTWTSFLTEHRLKLLLKILPHLLETFLVFGVLLEPVRVQVLSLELIPTRMLIPLFGSLLALPSLEALIYLLCRSLHLFLHFVEFLLHFGLVERAERTLVTLLFAPLFILLSPLFVPLFFLLLLLLPTLMTIAS